jgi:ribonuclease VapC
LTYLAAHIKARHTVSYADAYAAALAKDEDGYVATGDPEFKALNGFVRVVWLPEKH